MREWRSRAPLVTLAPIDQISGGPTSSNIYSLGLGQGKPTPFNQRGSPTPSSLPRNTHGGPERGPTLSSSPIVCIPLGCSFCFLDTPGTHEAKTPIEHFVTHLPHKVVVFLILRVNKGKLINSEVSTISLFTTQGSHPQQD